MRSKLTWLLLGIILTLVAVFLSSLPSIDLEVLIQHPFVKTIFIPIMLAILSALLEQIPKQAKGMGQGDDKYKIWLHQQKSSGDQKIISVDRQSLEDIARIYRRIIDIERMASFSLPEFSSVAINLIIGALAVDIAAITASDNKPTKVALWLTFHLIMLVGIAISLIISQRSPPDERRNSTIVAIILGFVAIMFAFGVS